MISSAFAVGVVDGLEKTAARVPVVHGTSGAWPVLKAGVGKAVAAADPNPRSVYMAGKTRDMINQARRFARDAVKARGGSPVVAHAKVDTRRGWEPRTLTAWGRKNVGEVDDMHDIVRGLDDKSLTKAERGRLWEKVNRGVGSWHNPENLSGATVKPTRYRR